MQEINAAYEQIKNPEAYRRSQGYGSQGYGSQGYGGQGYGGYGQSYDYGPFGGNSWKRSHYEDEDPYMRSAYQYLVYGRYQEALNALQNCGKRTARWYYLSALANDGLGNQVTALEHIRQAAAMDPENMEYAQVQREIENGGSGYRRRAGGFRGFNIRGGLWPLCLCWICQMFCCRGRFFCI
jgi:molecular chaperone DnaJ